MSLFDNTSQLNTNASRWWALVTIASFIIGLVLPAITKTHVYTSVFFLGAEAALFVGTVATVEVGFKNTFETNDDWKTWVQVASAFANILVPVVFFISPAFTK